MFTVQLYMKINYKHPIAFDNCWSAIFKFLNGKKMRS